MKNELNMMNFALPKPTARTPVNEKAATKFESLPTHATPPSRSRMRRAELGERMAIYLPPNAAEQLRVRCARERRSYSDAVTEAVEMWLQSATP